MIKLHEPHAALDHAAGEQAVRAEPARRLVIEAVHFLRFGRFLREIDGSGTAACMRKASS